MIKPDYDQIAAIEKAIQERYGELAVVDLSSLWNENKEKGYIEQIKMIESLYREEAQEDLVDENGFFMKKKLSIKSNFKNCSICRVPAFKTKDELYMIKFDCCTKCFIQHYEGRELKWQK